jgi:hypothetical protein
VNLLCLWLIDEENPDAAKNERDGRWRELRKLQKAHTILGIVDQKDERIAFCEDILPANGQQ